MISLHFMRELSQHVFQDSYNMDLRNQTNTGVAFQREGSFTQWRPVNVNDEATCLIEKTAREVENSPE